MTPAEEQDEPRIIAIPEFTVDGKTQHVPVEPSTAVQVGWSQHDPATEYLHTPVKLKLDLHDIYTRGEEIELALRASIDEAVTKKAPLVEIIPGKGSGQLKKRVLRFLDRKEIKALYHHVEKDSDNFGRVFVHFRWK